MLQQRHRKLVIALCVLGMFFCAGIAGASLYFYNYAFVPSHKSFLSQHVPKIQRDAKAWLATAPKEVWHEKAVGANLKLDADYIPAAHETTKTVVVAHGYMQAKEDMASRIRLFHNAGFNVLAPDDRGHGHSQGNYVGYGWPDRLDYLKWLDQLLRRKGDNTQIALYGESMGGATVMYLSGEKLPRQVKVIVEDCGYTSIMSELAYQAKAMFKLPKYPLVPAVALTASLKAHYNVFEASTIAALHHNTRPILFVHGGADKFVPTWMAYKEYAATTAQKKLWIVPQAGHARSLNTDPAKYRRVVVGWINRHF